MNVTNEKGDAVRELAGSSGGLAAAVAGGLEAARAGEARRAMSSPAALDAPPPGMETNCAAWIGIDCGVYGAVAIVTEREAQVFDTPVQTAKKGLDYVPEQMAALLRPYGGCVAILEYASAPRKRETQAGFEDEKMTGNLNGAMKIGFGSGLWEGILAACGIFYLRPTPQVWRRAVGLAAGTDKDASLELARSLYPALAKELRFKKNHGRAEALLMARYGQLRWASPLAASGRGRRAGA